MYDDMTRADFKYRASGDQEKHHDTIRLAFTLRHPREDIRAQPPERHPALQTPPHRGPPARRRPQLRSPRIHLRLRRTQKPSVPNLSCSPRAARQRGPSPPRPNLILLVG